MMCIAVFNMSLQIQHCGTNTISIFFYRHLRFLCQLLKTNTRIKYVLFPNIVLFNMSSSSYLTQIISQYIICSITYHYIRFRFSRNMMDVCDYLYTSIFIGWRRYHVPETIAMLFKGQFKIQFKYYDRRMQVNIVCFASKRQMREIAAKQQQTLSRRVAKLHSAEHIPCMYVGWRYTSAEI